MNEHEQALRDMFAAHVLPTMADKMYEAVLDAQALDEGETSRQLAEDQFRLAAGLAYKYADAMMEARKQQKS